MKISASHPMASIRNFRSFLRHIRLLAPKKVPVENYASFVPTRIWGNDGIDLNQPLQAERLRRWRLEYQELFKELRVSPSINTMSPDHDYLHNGYFGTPDAEVYAAMVADSRPSRIVEIGSGYSTLIAKTVSRRLGIKCSIVIVDPEPRVNVAGMAEKIFLDCVEDIEFKRLEIDERTILFIDSTHLCKPGGDIPYLYAKVLPSVPAGVLVHVHDVFIPYDYPAQYQIRCYTEQYLLHALLSHSERYEVIFATHFMSRTHRKEMNAAFGDIVGNHDLYYGASFWFQIR